MAKGNYYSKGMGNGGKYKSHSKGGGMKGGTNTGGHTGLKKEDSQRADVMKAPSYKNAFPKGMA